jgi:hypothetical protein
MRVETIFEMPGPSTALVRRLGELVHEGRRTFALHGEFEDPESARVQAVTLRFFDVHAYRLTFLPSLTEWQITSAYDRLVRVVDSEWLASLPGAAGLSHYMLTVDDGPCYELAARSVEGDGV